MASTEPTGEEALAEQAGAAFAEGDCAQALELLVQLQKQREDGALLFPPPSPPANRLAVESGLIVWVRVRCDPVDRHSGSHTTQHSGSQPPP